MKWSEKDLFLESPSEICFLSLLLLLPWRYFETLFHDISSSLILPWLVPIELWFLGLRISSSLETRLSSTNNLHQSCSLSTKEKYLFYLFNKIMGSQTKSIYVNYIHLNHLISWEIARSFETSHGWIIISICLFSRAIEMLRSVFSK